MPMMIGEGGRVRIQLDLPDLLVFPEDLLAGRAFGQPAPLHFCACAPYLLCRSIADPTMEAKIEVVKMLLHRRCQPCC